MTFITLTIISGVFTIAMLIIKFVWQDFKLQEEAIEGKKYRRIHGAFNIDQYFEDDKLIKDLDWTKQIDYGPDPKKHEGFRYRLSFNSKTDGKLD